MIDFTAFRLQRTKYEGILFRLRKQKFLSPFKLNNKFLYVYLFIFFMDNIKKFTMYLK